MKNGMIVLVGNTLAEVEADLNACKAAMSTGKMMGCGGKNIEEATKALYALAEALGAKVEMPSAQYPCPCSKGKDEVVIEVGYCDVDDLWDEDEDDDEYTEEDVDNIIDAMDDNELLDLISKATKELSNRA